MAQGLTSLMRLWAQMRAVEWMRTGSLIGSDRPMIWRVRHALAFAPPHPVTTHTDGITVAVPGTLRGRSAGRLSCPRRAKRVMQRGVLKRAGARQFPGQGSLRDRRDLVLEDADGPQPGWGSD